MKKTVKGSGLLIVVACVACVAVGAGGMYLYMKSRSGGLGDGTEIAVAVNEAVPVSEEIPQISETLEIPETTEPETESQTEPPTEPLTEQGGYVVISVVGNDYLYGNQIYDLDDLLAILKNSKELPAVRIVDEKASRKAYQELTSALQNEHISIVKAENTY
ncbi:MAG: hypothetical protein IKI37_09350 [Oscillospiraceae bacterium]|nr:hypothetical protein [Oscillospiraceae bacterium]MBR7085361.1 hypothetical protein [Oscillospiraceae bacterium]